MKRQPKMQFFETQQLKHRSLDKNKKFWNKLKQQKIVVLIKTQMNKNNLSKI